MSVKGNFSNSVGFTPPGAGVQMSVSPAPSAVIYLFAKRHSTGCSGLVSLFFLLTATGGGHFKVLLVILGEQWVDVSVRLVCCVPVDT